MSLHPIPPILRVLMTLLVVAGIVGGATLVPGARTSEGATPDRTADTDHEAANGRTTGGGSARRRLAPSPRAATSPIGPDDGEVDDAPDGAPGITTGRASVDDPASTRHDVPTGAARSDGTDADPVRVERSRPRSGDPVGPRPGGASDEPGTVLGSLDDPELPADAPRAVRDLLATATEPGFNASGSLAAPSSPSGTVAVPLGPNALKAGPGCSVGCITSGVAYSLGTRATLVAATDTPAVIWLFVWDDSGLFLAETHDEPTTGLGRPFDGLQPGTTYEAAVIAVDAQGFQDARYGRFTTLRRFVQVAFDTFEVDAYPYDGAVYVHYQVGGQWQADATRRVTRRGGATTVYAPEPMVFGDLGEATSLVVQVVSTGGAGGKANPDGGLPFDECGASVGPYDPAWDQKGTCTAYANATNHTIHLAGVPNTAHPQSPHAILGIPLVGDGAGVGFTTYATVLVWYA